MLIAFQVLEQRADGNWKGYVMHDGHRRIGHFPSQAVVLVDSQGQWRSQNFVLHIFLCDLMGGQHQEKVDIIDCRTMIENWYPAVSFVGSWHNAIASAIMVLSCQWWCGASTKLWCRITVQTNVYFLYRIVWLYTLILYFSRSKEPASPALQLRSVNVTAGSRSHQQQAQPPPRTRAGKLESSVERAHPQPVRQYRTRQNVPSATFTTRTAEES